MDSSTCCRMEGQNQDSLVEENNRSMILCGDDDDKDDDDNNKNNNSLRQRKKASNNKDCPNQFYYYQVCPICHGKGKLIKPPSRKARLRYNKKRGRINNGSDDSLLLLSNPIDNTTITNKTDNSSVVVEGIMDTTTTTTPMNPIVPLNPRMEPCSACQSTGLQRRQVVVGSNNHHHQQQQQQELYYKNDLPLVAIVGGGIAGLALAIACRHRGIPHFVLERDIHFSQRQQGYGLTLQQASKALKYFGKDVEDAILQQGITSTRHVVHTTDGQVVGEWGFRKWGRRPLDNDNKKKKKEPKRQNIHIARQELRYQLLQAADESRIHWNSRLIQYKETEQGLVELLVQTTANKNDDDNEQSSTTSSSSVTTTTRTITANLLVGADGIRSQVRKQLIGDTKTPLRYLGCLVVLGIVRSSLLDAEEEVDKSDVQSLKNELLDGATVFQTANGESTRIYIMPYSKTEYMWQLSFPMSTEQEAMNKSIQGPESLKQEALNRCGSWHFPIPEIIQATPISFISGYPIYDRTLLDEEQLNISNCVTLIGDACHPMSPFKVKINKKFCVCFLCDGKKKTERTTLGRTTRTKTNTLFFVCLFLSLFLSPPCLHTFMLFHMSYYVFI